MDFYLLFYFLLVLEHQFFIFGNIFFKKVFNIKYSTKNIFSLTEDENNNIDSTSIEMLINTIVPSMFEAKLYIIHNDTNMRYYDESNITRYNDNLDIDFQGSLFCFNATEQTSLTLKCLGNCSDPLGNDVLFIPQIYTKSLIIQHNESYPFKTNIDKIVKTFYPLNVNSLTKHIIRNMFLIFIF